MYGTYKEAYNLVLRMLHQIVEANPGTYINKLDRIDPHGGPNYYILNRVF